MDRIAALKSMIERSPADPFPRYGLAMEHKSLGDHEEASRVFGELMERFPDYVPAYLHAGASLLALGQRDQAAEVYRKGIDASRRKGDHHALGELEGALADLEAQ